MKGQNFSILAFLLTMFLFFWGCASDNIGPRRIFTGPAARDLVEYTNQGLLRIAELERKSLASYAAVTGDNYTTEQSVYEELKNFVIPTYKRFLEGLKNIKPENEEIQTLHRIYIGGAELIYDGFKTKMVGIENNNESIIIQGNQKIEEGRKEIERWDQERIKLYKEQGVAEVGKKE